MKPPYELSREYLELFGKKTIRSLRSRRVLPRYLGWLFSGVPLEGSTVYDIGGGTGLISFYAAEQGAKKVLCVEPLAEGSRDDMLTGFAEAQRTLRNGSRVSLERVELCQFAEQSHPPADVVILHNVVNHLDEDACRRISNNDESARASYIEQFRSFKGMLRDNGILIIADAGRDSFWTEIGVYNPFAPTIDRSVHQQPEIWQALLEQSGFERQDIRWTPFLSLMMGVAPSPRPVSSRSLSSYYSLGHFALRMRKHSTSASDTL
ncbi:class I SAM-dependent methyltransferase [Mesorhizobium sp.]|uniref:class I SAM-dependent methyltransferase n=1 Tax=Mesorhizobium sp. TaxID=1871066 RepID=UPI000FE8581B|nr:class I SAM-dependent methyltransferase [Mesorhizobium sp.]RWB06304.1 MAG: class I SAM-dependent methyltransferase [Mesorhizobium sp.]